MYLFYLDHLKVENKSTPEETRDDKKRKLSFKVKVNVVDAFITA